MKFVITADSIPEYDMPMNPFDDAWGINDWITWHKAMKAKYGPTVAMDRMIAAWEDQSIWSMPYNTWKYNQTFVDYFNSEGFDVGHALSKTVMNVSESAESISAGLPTLSKWLVPLLIAGVGAYAYNSIKQ